MITTDTHSSLLRSPSTEAGDTAVTPLAQADLRSPRGGLRLPGRKHPGRPGGSTLPSVPTGPGDRSITNSAG